MVASRQKKLLKSYIMESGELLEFLFWSRKSILWISGIKEQTEKGLRIICLSFRLIICAWSTHSVWAEQGRHFSVDISYGFFWAFPLGGGHCFGDSCVQWKWDRTRRFSGCAHWFGDTAHIPADALRHLREDMCISGSLWKPPYCYGSQLVLPIQPLVKWTALIKARAIVLHLCLFNLNVAFSCIYKKGKVNCLPCSWQLMYCWEYGKGGFLIHLS